MSPTSIWYFRSLCGAKYNACYFCCTVALFSSLWDLHITQAFDAPSANLERKRLHPLRRTVGVFTRSRFSVMLSIIIGVNILNWYGTVIAQSGRQFDARQQHLLLRRNGRRVKKNIKKKRWFKCNTKHETFFTDTFILCLRNKIKCSFT